ncbi:head GIN domain-containing protein [Pedobacter sp. L105]|uniref:head GIN domain-containing protein n=1 Tax=Pedobacter sp. L105 TaxID=1641871 RepID=UPI00131CF99A|nr:head GIN domain-containing protein [Pedobacter sp. L105]
MKSFQPIKFIYLFLIAVTFSMSLKAQETRNVSVKYFSEISVSAGIELHILQAASESAKIVANADVIDEVVVEKSGNRINVGWKDNWGFGKHHNNRKAKVYITYKNLNAIAASSGSFLKTENAVKTNHLDLSVSSGANIDAKIACGELELEASSGGSVSLTGIARQMVLESSSGGTVNALKVSSENARTTASSGGNIEVHVSKALETTTSSGGTIRYSGNPSLKDNSSRRTGDVQRIGE